MSAKPGSEALAAIEMGKTADSWTDGKGAYLHMLPVGDRGCVVVKTEMVF